MTREELEAKVGKVWNTEEVQKDFIVHSSLVPMVNVTRRVDGVRGIMNFQDEPRLYFRFVPGCQSCGE